MNYKAWRKLQQKSIDFLMNLDLGDRRESSGHAKVE